MLATLVAAQLLSADPASAPRGAFAPIAPIAPIVGGVLAAVVDSATLAWEPPPRLRAAHASIQWAPFAGAVRGAPAAGLSGTF